MVTRAIRAVIGAWSLSSVVMATPARACIWDRDTLRFETLALPGVVEIITGRIERYPPLYYEMRLARVAAGACERFAQHSRGILELAGFVARQRLAVQREVALCGGRCRRRCRRRAGCQRASHEHACTERAGQGCARAGCQAQWAGLRHALRG